MNTAEKLTQIAEKEAHNIELNRQLEQILYSTDTGGKSYYDKFWDKFQLNGERWWYNYAFYYWDFDLFYPKYDIKPKSECPSMFHFAGKEANNTYTSYCDLIARLKECGVTLDLSQVKGMDYAFYGSGLITIPTVDARGITLTRYLWYTFAQNTFLKKIEKLIVLEETTYGNTFTGDVALEEIEFEGIIGNDINFGDCKVLNKASQTNIVEHLSETTTGKTITFSKTAVNNAFGIDIDDPTTYPEGSEFYDLRNSRSNWTFAYK